MERSNIIAEIIDDIVDTIEENYADEKENIINDLYSAGGESQYLEDMLYNNSIDYSSDCVDLIEEGLTLEELKYVANELIKKLENNNYEVEEGKQQIINEINESIDFDKEIEDLENEVKDIEEQISEVQNLINNYDGERDNVVDEWEDEIEELKNEKQECLDEIEILKNDKKNSIKTEDVEEDLELNIEQANGATEQDLEQITLSNEELSENIKLLMDEEKDKISKLNEFLNNIASKLPKEVYEVIESEVNEMKDKSIENQNILNKIYNALGFIISPQTAEGEQTNEIIEIDDNEDEDIFNSLKEEGKLHFENLNTLTRDYSMIKGLELNEELEMKVKRTMLEKYSILENKEYTLISKEGIKNKLKLEAKAQSQKELEEKVKKEAEENAKETGEDTYVYRIGDDVFFATEKPTHTALFNKALVVGKYKVSTNGKEVTTTWFGENKEKEYKYKRTLKEAFDKDVITKDIIGKSVEDGINYINKLTGNNFIGTGKETELFNNEGFAMKYNSENGDNITLKYDNNNNIIGVASMKLTDLFDLVDEKAPCMVPGVPDGKTVESPISGISMKEKKIIDPGFEEYVRTLLKDGAIDDPEHIKSLSDEEFEDLLKNTWMKDPDVIADYQSIAETKQVNESKESEIIEEIGEDYEKLTFEEYKKRNKEFIELCYRNTWGEEEIDKDLYEDLANSMYSDSITGNINTKEDYSSLNDKIEEADIETINDETK